MHTVCSLIVVHIHTLTVCSLIHTYSYAYRMFVDNSYIIYLQFAMKGTEVPNPRCSSACDCTCVLTRIDHCLVNNSIMTFALELIWHAF